MTRDRSSALKEVIPAADLTVCSWMNGLIGKRFLAENSDLRTIVWTLDDMNPFTGVCHYSADCRGFETECNSCPAVGQIFRRSVSESLKRKIAFSKARNISFVAPTDWILKEFSTSRLAGDSRIYKILNPLQELYFERATESFEPGRRLRILVVAVNLDDPIKGVWDVAETLNAFAGNPSIEVSLVGRASTSLRKTLPQVQFKGSLDSLAVREQMRFHDLLVVPSLFENAGTVIAEAASQGTPSIARNIGGMPEMTNYGRSGYVFEDSGDLFQKVMSLTHADINEKATIAMDWAQGFRPELVARRYADYFLS